MNRLIVLLVFLTVLPRLRAQSHTEMTLEDNQTVTGQKAFAGNNTHSGTETFTNTVMSTGANNHGQVNGVYNIGACSSSPAPAWCSGSDVGAWVNAAYAACPSTGCRIHISAQASCYSYSTPIALSTNGKPAILEGDGSG